LGKDNSNIEKQMIHQNDFKPLRKDAFTEPNHDFRTKQGVIKQKDVKIHNPVKLSIEESESILPESIQPMIEDGCVIGVIYRCECGKSTEIRFEYEN